MWKSVSIINKLLHTKRAKKEVREENKTRFLIITKSSYLNRKQVMLNNILNYKMEFVWL